MPCGNYSNLVAGLYSWRLSLPVNGFICPATDEIKTDLAGNCQIMDSIVSLKERENADPASPSNLERLEEVFASCSLMLKHFIYPSDISDEEAEKYSRKLFLDYNIYADKPTSRAFAAAAARKEMTDEDEACTVLVMRDHPALSSSWIRHAIGETPEMPECVKSALVQNNLERPLAKTSGEVLEIMKKYLGK